MRAVSELSVGLPVVLMVVGSNGLRHTVGADDYVAIAASLDPRKIRWCVVDVEEEDALPAAV